MEIKGRRLSVAGYLLLTLLAAFIVFSRNVGISAASSTATAGDHIQFIRFNVVGNWSQWKFTF